MNKKYSQILLLGTLMLLASFLVFWLYGEYQRAKHAMQNEMYLEVAEKLIGYGGGDFRAILSELEGLPLDGAVKIGVVIEDSMSQVESLDQRMSRENRAAHIEHAFLQSDTITNDTFTQITTIRRNRNEEGGNNLMSIVMDMNMQRQEMAYSSDSLVAFSNGTDFLHHLRGNLNEDREEIRTKALFSIIPQILFSIFLFGLLTGGIFLLQKSNKDQQELLESKNNLISNITHELQTPIATIAVALEAIQDFNVNKDPEKTNRYIQTSRNELQRLSTVVDQVMMLSKMDSRAEMYRFESVDIAAIGREVLRGLQVPIAQKEMNVKVQSDDLLMAKVDPNHFKSMLYNLIDNSLKYGKKGGQINLEFENLKNSFLIRIRDNGIGIPQKYWSKIFERFYRISSGDRHDVKGYGLGLSYVNEIVKAHQGTIDVESEVGEGTTFTINFPHLKSTNI